MNEWCHICPTASKEAAYGKEPKSHSESPNFQLHDNRDEEGSSKDIHCQNYSAGNRIKQKLHLKPLSPACYRQEDIQLINTL